MRILSKGIIAILVTTLTGCHVPSSVALGGSGGRNAFNATLHATSNEELLLNLVRLRYCDTPYFLNVTNITSQVTYEAEATTKLFFPGFNRANPASIGGGMLWKSQPTIVYAPLEGSQFSELLLKPIKLLFIQQLVYSGWDIDRVFKLTVQSFNNIHNAPTASGPFPNSKPVYKDFYRITELFRYFQKNNELHVGIKSTKNEGSGATMSLQIFFPNRGKEAKELASYLYNTEPANGYNVIDMKLGFQEEGKTGIMPRSVLSCMYYLSLGVDIPLQHELNNIGVTTCDDLCPFNWSQIIRKLITVHHSRKEPRSSYIAVKYRGFWFYIDESDITSKRTFVLLLNLFNLQAGNTKSAAPILTIPVGI